MKAKRRRRDFVHNPSGKWGWGLQLVFGLNLRFDVARKLCPHNEWVDDSSGDVNFLWFESAQFKIEGFSVWFTQAGTILEGAHREPTSFLQACRARFAGRESSFARER